MNKYDYKKIEAKWQKYWSKYPEVTRAENKSDKEKQYILDMWPYPSGDGLHVGHVESYTATDIMSRYLRMNGKNVLHPQGWDAFGLPAENFAIKTKIHPAETTKKAIATFKKQMNMMGFSYDWSREAASNDPEYYKWTQWFFLLFYKNGLAYKKKAKVNWCNQCQTVLANEQAEGGICERCKNEVVQKDMEQWFFKITDFIEDKTPLTPLVKGGATAGLLSGLEKVDWPESTKAAQKNWIGRSEGAEVDFVLDNGKKITVYTTRIDTIFSGTFIILAPEHPLVSEITMQEQKKDVEKYVIEAAKKTELERTGTKLEKTGVFTGAYVLNPATNEKIPVWISDFVLVNYGTGVVFADAHDERDFEIAKKYGIPLKVSLRPKDDMLWKKVEKLEECFSDEGILVNSEQFDGLTSAEARPKIIDWLGEKGLARKKVNYRLRDWLVSRQRYWGAPIPIIYCDACKNKKYNYVILHGYSGTGKYNGPAANSTENWRWWIKNKLEEEGKNVFCPDLPNTEEPNIEEQVGYVLKNTKIDENTILISHSLGAVVIYKLLEKINKKVAKVLFVDPVVTPNFSDKKRPMVEQSVDWKFNWKKIKKASNEFIILADSGFKTIFEKDLKDLSENLDSKLILVNPKERHFTAYEEASIWRQLEQTGMYPVPEKDLPVELPNDVDFMPTGESPLVKSKKFHKVKCPVCGGPARRESDTMDTFVCSSWYYFRYADNKNKKEFAGKEMIKKWLPVDLYVGGAEHTVLHLLYARFFTKVLHNLGYIDFDEPFLKLRHQGIILAEDGRKMSKSFGNVINPDDVVKQYGADALRMFEMFMGPLEDMKPWNTRGIVGISRFLEKIYKFYHEIKFTDCGGGKKPCENVPGGMPQMLHKTIKKVTEDIEGLRFNTAISQMMIFMNFASKFDSMPKAAAERFLILLSPFAPHLAEELWEKIKSPLPPFSKGGFESIFKQNWPKYNPDLVKEETIKLVLQVNGKVRDMIEVAADISEDEAKKIALENEKVKKWLEDREPKKVIFVKGKLINIVI